VSPNCKLQISNVDRLCIRTEIRTKQGVLMKAGQTFQNYIALYTFQYRLSVENVLDHCLSKKISRNFANKFSRIWKFWLSMTRNLQRNFVKFFKQPFEYSAYIHDETHASNNASVYREYLTKKVTWQFRIKILQSFVLTQKSLLFFFVFTSLRVCISLTS
jgi:hypothetical protein